MPGSGRAEEAATALLLAGLGLVLWRYQVISPAQPLAVVGLTAGWVLLFALSCYGVGHVPAGRVARLAELSAIERLLVSVGLGAGGLSLVAFLLGAAGLLYPGLLTGVLGAAAVAGVVAAARAPVGAWRCRGGFPAAALGALAVIGAITLLAAATPSAFYDQLNYHLAFPFQWLRHHRLVEFPRHDYSLLPSTMGPLYAYALPLLGVSGAQAIHWLMGALSVATVAALAGRVFGASAGWWAAAIFATTPAVMLAATWAGTDLGTTAFAGLAWLLADAGWERDERWIWGACGVFVGLAVGCKLVAIATVAVPLALVSLAAGPTRRGWPARLRRVTWVIGGAAAAFLPWAVRNTILVANPIFPLFSQSGVGGGAAIRQAVGSATLHWDAVGAWAVAKLSRLLLGTFDPRGEAGVIGPVYLALLPAAVLLAWRRGSAPERRLVAGALCAVAGWSVVPPLGRYVLPALVLVAAIGGGLLSRIVGWLRGRVRRAFVALLAVVLGWAAVSGISPPVMSRVSCTLGLIELDAWMTRSVDYWPAARFINAELPGTAKILLVGESRTVYIEREVVVEDPFQKPFLVRLAEQQQSHEAMARALAGMGVTHLLVNLAEETRIAAMNHRAGYFAEASPAARERLQAFLHADVESVFRAGPVEVLRLRTAGSR